MVNEEVRQAITDHNVYQWQVADALGVSSDTLSRWMRHELSADRKQKIMHAIEEAAAKAKTDGAYRPHGKE